MGFVNLYLETEYSMLRSTIKLEELIKKSKDEGISSLAITDNSNMHGAFKFYNLCVKNNIKPLIGLNIELESQLGFYNNILLYAKGELGYKNLMALATFAKLKKRVSLKDFKKHSQDLICILPSDENEIVKLIYEDNLIKAREVLKTYKEIINELYLGVDLQSELSRLNIGKVLDFAGTENLVCVALNKTSYFEKEDFEVYKLLRSVDLGINEYPSSEKEANQYFISKQGMEERFSKYPSLIKNTEVISKKCNLKLNYSGYYFPSFPDAMGKSFEYLTQLCKLGLNKRLENQNLESKKYVNRLFYELDIINKMGFCDYFLIVYDFIKYAKKNGILVGPGRGSAPGSLVAYCLGITDIDPIKYDLLFERFLNPERSTMPDIDVDFPDNRRDEVIDYVVNKYGRNKVANITTFGTFGPRLAIRDVARVFKLNDNIVNEVLRHVSNNDKSILEVVEKDEVFARLVRDNSEVARLVRIVSKMEGLPRHTSTHAAGIIIASEDLRNYTPLQTGVNNILQTQFEASDLEEIGLVKIDFLGIRNLTIIDDVIKKIKKDEPSFNIYNISLTDKYTYQMIATGDTDGIFQLESSGMRNVLVKLKTSTFMDIVNANALYRPGPMEMIDSFINRKSGREKIDYIDPSLQEILEPTYGTIVFQEQIMLIAQKFAGYSLGMADILRRAVSKKDRFILEDERKRFVEGALNEGHSKEIANQVYNYIVKFANYGFNKSHSVAYSMISYTMAYLKRHYYRYFMSTLMGYSIGSVDSIRSYINDCKKKEVVVNLPNVNYSRDVFVVHNDEIYYSLLGISNLGVLSLQKLLAERDENGIYKSYQEFITRTKDILNKRVVENMIHAGACDVFGMPRKQMIIQYDNCLNIAKYNDIIGENLLEKDYSDEEYSFEEISYYEQEALGFNLKYSIFIKYQHLVKKYNTLAIKDLNIGKRKLTIFAIKHIKEIITKNNEEMAFLSVYDDSAEIDVVVFPQAYREYKNNLEVKRVYLARGDVDLRNEKKQFVLKQIKLLK